MLQNGVLRAAHRVPLVELQIAGHYCLDRCACLRVGQNVDVGTGAADRLSLRRVPAPGMVRPQIRRCLRLETAGALVEETPACFCRAHVHETVVYGRVSTLSGWMVLVRLRLVRC